MAYNLFISYDLVPPGQNYEAVQAKIKSLGRWYHLQYSVFYVHTAFSAQQAHAAVWSVMDVGDKLAVIDATSAFVTPAIRADVAAINSVWYSGAA